MAKEERVEEVEEKKGSLLKTLILWLVVPLLFITAVLLIVAKVANVNVIDQAKKWTTSLIAGEEDLGEKRPELADEETLVALQAELQQKEKELAKLKEQLEKSEETQEKMKMEAEQLKDEAAKEKSEEADVQVVSSDIIKTFDQMSAKAAAPVLLEMNDLEAVHILMSLKPDKVAQILEKMEPVQAAKYTTLLAREE